MAKPKQTLDLLYVQLGVVEDLIRPHQELLNAADSILTPKLLIDITLFKQLLEKQLKKANG